MRTEMALWTSEPSPSPTTGNMGADEMLRTTTGSPINSCRSLIECLKPSPYGEPYGDALAEPTRADLNFLVDFCCLTFLLPPVFLSSDTTPESSSHIGMITSTLCLNGAVSYSVPGGSTHLILSSARRTMDRSPSS